MQVKLHTNSLISASVLDSTSVFAVLVLVCTHQHVLSIVNAGPFAALKFSRQVLIFWAS